MIHWQIKYRDVDQFLCLKQRQGVAVFLVSSIRKKRISVKTESLRCFKIAKTPFLVVKKKKRAGDKSTPFTVSVRAYIETRGRYGPTYTTKIEYYGRPTVYVRAHHC